MNCSPTTNGQLKNIEPQKGKNNTNSSIIIDDDSVHQKQQEKQQKSRRMLLMRNLQQLMRSGAEFASWGWSLTRRGLSLTSKAVRRIWEAPIWCSTHPHFWNECGLATGKCCLVTWIMLPLLCLFSYFLYIQINLITASGSRSSASKVKADSDIWHAKFSFQPLTSYGHHPITAANGSATGTGEEGQKAWQKICIANMEGNGWGLDGRPGNSGPEAVIFADRLTVRDRGAKSQVWTSVSALSPFTAVDPADVLDGQRSCSALIFYFEVTVQRLRSEIAIGLSGVDFPIGDGDTFVGKRANSFGLGQDGTIWKEGLTYSNGFSGFSTGDVVGCGLLLHDGTTLHPPMVRKIFWSKNDQLVVGPFWLPSSADSLEHFFPTASLKGNGNNMASFNFGSDLEKPFKYQFSGQTWEQFLQQD